MNSYVVTNCKKWMLLLAMAGATSCMKPEPIFEVEPVTVNVQGGTKKAMKTNRQFVSGAYSDLTNKQIATSELDDAMVCYEGFGEDYIIRDMIVRDMIKRSAVVIPSATEMRNDVNGFVRDTYTRFYKREPSDLEKWTVQNQIAQDTTITPVMVYYSFMSAEEYLYY
ncbi:MAG: hypothetical protein KBB64_02950 [Bacteroidia bacterium]|nr:hypothetical protein [Bacteroidia bacterium]